MAAVADKKYFASLADLLFPSETLLPEYYEAKYPPRELRVGAAVTRLGPSPTGFIHLGNLFMAIVNQKLAEQSGGVFILRIEDTDQKREVEGAAPGLIESLAYFGISFDEGVGLAGNGTSDLASFYSAGCGVEVLQGVERKIELTERGAELTERGAGLTERGAELTERGAELTKRVAGLTERGAELTERGAELKECGAELTKRVAELTERGEYGPYFQSARRDIYHAFARSLVLEGKAYPCFMTEEETSAIRAGQEAAKELPGIYGSYAKWRGADLELVAEKIHAGVPYAIRLFADYENFLYKNQAGEIAADQEGNNDNGGDIITVADGIRGDITMPKNIMDIIILKKDGLPTYHFAHVVDDHFMRTTHVVRGEEWLSSLPIHIALFRALGFEPPVYCHTALLMKLDGGVKRKLSKRKDPELALSYYISDGYHPAAVREYMYGVINSNYEEWRLSNPDADNMSFELTTERMGASGILFDLIKLQNVSRDTLSRIPAAALADFMIYWAERERPDAFPVLLENKTMLIKALDIGRGGEKPRKDLAYASQIFDFISYFFDPFFVMEDPLPDNIPEAEARLLLEEYLACYDHADDRERWFEKIRELAAEHGYAPKPKDFKNNPGMYKGHVGDVSTVIRRALTGRQNAPDIYEIQQILGESRVRERIETATIIDLL